MNGKLYRDYSDFLAERFTGKMQKLTVNAGFSCPNRDGTKGRGGCIYCNNETFNPSFSTKGESVGSQLEKGKQFFSKKYPGMRYLAYFQAYTNTHSKNVNELVSLYREALAVEKVDGIIIGTRPDTVSDELLGKLAEIDGGTHRVMMEYGAESSHDVTLRLINRCHTWDDTVSAVKRTHEVGIDVGLHLIMGLPGESEEMMIETVRRVSDLPIQTVKFHQLQIVRNTPLAKMWEEGKIDVRPFGIEEYLDLCVKILSVIDPSIAIERFTSQSPDSMLIAPRWGVKNYEFVEKLRKRLNG